MMTSSNGNIFRVTGHLCGEFTGHRWIPHTKVSDAELWRFLWSRPSHPLWRHSNDQEYDTFWHVCSTFQTYPVCSSYQFCENTIKLETILCLQVVLHLGICIDFPYQKCCALGNTSVVVVLRQVKVGVSTYKWGGKSIHHSLRECKCLWLS